MKKIKVRTIKINYKQMKKISLLLAAALLTSSLTAQDLDQCRHEISINGGVGLSSLQYDPSTGKHKIGFGGQAGLGYTFFFSPHWGLRTGAEIAFYQAKTNLLDFTDSYNVTGVTAADNYTYTYKLNKYSESQKALYVNIPLMLQYQTGGKQKFFLAFGAKVGFPVKATAQTNDYSLTAEGYYPAEGRTYYDLPQYGFGTFDYKGSKTDLDFSLNLMASAEIGAKWKIGKKNALYTGIYADYGFRNIQKTNDKVFVQNAGVGSNPSISPIVESQHAGKAFTDKIAPLAVGLKIRFAFSLGKNFQKPVYEEIIVENMDFDNDGVPDNIDKCPNTPEGIQVNENGCPLDTDNDGVPNYLDNCPNTPEGIQVDVNGCSIDTDKDGVADYLDKCPNTPVGISVDSDGCSQDSDGDGIADYLDACPNTVGIKENNGCPEVKATVKQIFEKALQGIQFETGKDVIKAVSFPILNDIENIMNENPAYNLQINGHTDDSGTYEINQILSEKRANAVKDYLVSKGVEANRLTAQGFGESKPVVPNTSEANRTKNRRVEFVVKFETTVPSE
jgi:outer membrane protein OmpA-like peptidoglycan-associated protein